MQKNDDLEILEEKHYILLDKLVSNGVVCEESGEFEESIFSDVYKKAFKLMESIIEDNEEWKNWKRKNRNSAFEISNIISFVGRRGTGKTSSMLAVAKALNDYSTEQRYGHLGKSQQFSKNINEKNIVFYELDCIDASVMEESEDIFTLILANMFEKILNLKGSTDGKAYLNLSDYRNRTIFQKMEKIYEDFVALKKNSEESEGYSTFEKLRTLASSQKIRKDFENLVNLYLEIMEDNDRRNDRQGYLVIILDDLDMIVERGEEDHAEWRLYRSMSNIQKYLTVPRVIVLTAYNNVNLQRRCAEFYREQYAVQNSQTAVHRGYENKAIQFIEKVFPIYTRIYMPSWRKRDLKGENRNKIKFVNCKTEVLKNFQEDNKPETEISIKTFCMALLSEKTAIYFDSAGKKEHFFEANTLRGLFNITRFLMELESLPLQLETKEDIQLFLYNIERMKEDCLFRFIEDKLYGDEYELFGKWQAVPIERRAQEIVRLISRTTIPLGLRIKEEHEEEVLRIEHQQEPTFSRTLDNSKVEYSYAELIHSIYHMTRDWKRYSKELACCILYSFTLQLTEIYEEYKWRKRQIEEEEFIQLSRKAPNSDNRKSTTLTENKNYEKSEEFYEILKAVMGETICGRWTEYYFPRVTCEMSGAIGSQYIKSQIVGYVEKTGQGFTFIISAEEDELKRGIQQFMLCSTFYLDVLSWTPFIFQSEKSGENIFISLAEGKRDFELTGLFKYAFCYTEYLSKIESLLLTVLKSFNDINENERNHYEMLIKEIFNEYWHDFYNWDKKYGNMMIPLCSLDISYNLVKHVFQECREVNLSNIVLQEIVAEAKKPNEKNNNFFREYIKMLDKFLNHLKQIDKDYGLEGTNSFAGAYENCPFYQMLKELYKDIEQGENAESSKHAETINKICNCITQVTTDLYNRQEAQKISY